MTLFLFLALGCNGGESPEDCGKVSAWWPDTDQDGFGDERATSATGCEPPSDVWVNNGRDCDDSNNNTWPGAAETCDGYDNDCDDSVDEDFIGATTWYEDSDGDGYGSEQGSMVESCDAPSGFVGNNTDCDDTSAITNVDAEEICDGLDNNCNGETDENLPTSTYYPDTDGDGLGDSESPVEACVSPSGHTDRGQDCDDTNASEPAWASANASGGSDGTESAPFGSIQEAITAGYACIIASPGSYNESVRVNQEAIEIISSDGSATTFISGTNGPAFYLDASPSATVSGFTVLDGQGWAPPNDALESVGHAFYISGGNAQLKDIVIDGIEVQTVFNGTNDLNGGLGVWISQGAIVDLEDITIQNVQGTWGAAIYNRDSVVTGRRVSLLNNTVGFTLVHISGLFEVDNLRVVGNSQVSGSSSYEWSLFYLYDGEVQLRNATIVDNNVSYIIVPVDARPTSDPEDQGGYFGVDSSIIAFNSSSELSADLGDYTADFNLSYTDLYGNLSNNNGQWIDAGGNLEVNPLLVSLIEDNVFAADDLHLQATSPCVDAGSSQANDPDGSPMDMGAYGGPNATW